jgi:hypothetical protein
VSDEQTRRLDVIVAAALAAVVLIVFAPGLVGPFLWDDVALIPGNLIVRSLANYRAWFARDFWDVSPELSRFGEHIHYYRPLITASYALDWRIGGGDPLAFHLTNNLLHAAVTVLTYALLRRWGLSLVAAACGAAVFALHPSKAESVAWISGRTDVVAMIFMLVAMVGASRRFRGARGGIALEVAATVLAYLSKEGAVVLPALIAAERWVSLGKPPLDRPVVTRVIRAAAPQLAIAVLYLIARAVWMPIRPAMPKMGLADHAQFFLESIGRYVAIALGVHPMSSQHALLRTFEGRWVHAPAWVALGVVALIAFGITVVMLRRRAPSIAMGLLLFAALLVPVSNLVLNGLAALVAERFLYAPLLGVALIVAVAVERFPSRIAALLVLSLVSVRTFVRATDFSDATRFWEREHALHPESIEAHRMLLTQARADHRYRAAAAMALEARTQAATYYRHAGDELEFVIAYLEVQALLIADHRPTELRAIDAFHASLLEPNTPFTDVATRDFTVHLDLTPALHRRAVAFAPRILVARADIASRLADDTNALKFVEDAFAQCPGCVAPAISGALCAARSGDYPRAYGYLDRHAASRGEASVAEQRKTILSAELAHRESAAATGPVALNLRAQELARLEAWGRAYDVLAPYRAQIELAPGFAIGFAELAFRAGESEVAREVLRKQLPQEKIEPTIAVWAQKMGWQ